MELKMNYQYTFFVYPFIINENRYQNYILKLLKDKNCKLKRYEKEKDLNTYKFFSNKTREFLFSTFSFTNEKFNKLQELPIETRAAILAKYPCNIFSYDLKKNVQGKAGTEKGIFFKIQKIEIICFKSGICFLAIKTNIEDSEEFSNLLNFNYKFRDINQDESVLNNYDNITIQTDSFETIDTFKDFIYSITGSNIKAMELDVDTERFLTYSYVCIDRKNWNADNNFNSIEHDFIKFTNVLPADNIGNFDKDEIMSFSKWNYAKMGLTKRSMVLMASSIEMNNYTILPDEYEKQYFYEYILALYKRLYLKKLSLECKMGINIKKTRKKFINFTKNLWTQEVSENDIGTMINQKLKEIFELDELYYKIKSEYDILYKELNIEKNRMSTALIAIVLITTLLFNILNFIMLLKK